MTWDLDLERRLRATYDADAAVEEIQSAALEAMLDGLESAAMHAPYKIMKRGNKWVVINNIGETKATFKSHKSALAYQRALYRNVPGAAKYAEDHKWTGKAPKRVKAWALGDSIVTEVSGRITITAPARALADIPAEVAAKWQQASEANPYFQWIQGRFVEAEQANSNGAFWSTGDLEFGEVGIKHGPLNWLHESRRVIGTIADARLVREDFAQHAALERPFIAATAAIWKWIYPDEAAEVQRASDSGNLYYSMECVAEKIQCAGDNGCGESFNYLQAVTQPTTACTHIQERSSVRRLVNPSFLGGAVIVPPVRPGWSGASAAVVKAAEESHDANIHGMSAAQWESLMEAVVAAM